MTRRAEQRRTPTAFPALRATIARTSPRRPYGTSIVSRTRVTTSSVVISSASAS